MFVQRMTDCQPGRKIYVEADAPLQTDHDHFGVDIYGNDAWMICMDNQPLAGVFRAIHIQARFHEQCVARNTRTFDNKWALKKEEKDGGMPIKSEETFILCITFQTNSFEIAFNGWHFAMYRYRTQFTPITTMLLSVIPYVRRIKYV